VRALPSAVRAALHVLEDAYPLDRPAEVEVPPHVVGWADTDRRDGDFLIRLSGRMDTRSLIETLAHEWAHARTWDVQSPLDHHDAWGIEFARAYRLLIDGVR
jgi:hypothetical protein